MQRNQGFSLLEVMVVLVIIGLILGVVAPNILGQGEAAKLKKVKLDIQQLENALGMYKFENGRYPSTEQGLEALVEKTEIDPRPRKFPEGGYVSKLPKDPWQNDYVLVSPGEFGKIDIFSVGPDSEAGTDDDIGNWMSEDNEEEQ
ncbi:type II secretion system major pseudopilin GspG [Algicola sagamiensis]|uniref:type II secretion system major pseudopilin GspG n=1 Tax=Algicola sagamiensis TaxID=163869 RepID=UPI00036565B2|nr:type II secretion system major pseudopilin GspG [Algicola sagamiensis]